MARLLIAGLLGAAAITPLLAQPAPVARVAPMVQVAPVTQVAPMAMARAPMTRADVQAHVAQMFAMHDTNRDGFLTADELKPAAGERTIMRHAMRGPDGDMSGPGGGAMAMRDPNVAFDRIDANHDGSISRSEFAAGRQIRIEKRIVMNAPGAPGQPHGMRMMRGGGMMGAALLKRADSNRDGRVSLAEATGAALQHFDMMDANRDGRITPDERAAGRQRMMQMRMQMHKAG